LFAETDLSPGSVLLSVNDDECTGKSLALVTNMVRTAEASLTVVALPAAQVIPFLPARTMEEVMADEKRERQDLPSWLPS